MKLTKSMKEQITSDIENALKTYYRVENCKKNKWRYNLAISQISERLKNVKDTEELPQIVFKGAQWGSKFGNYYRAIGLDCNKRYIYVEGFKNQLNKKLNYIY